MLSVWTQGLEVSSKEVGVGNLETSDSGVGFNTALPLDTDTDVPDQIPDSEAVSISIDPETKPSPPSAAETKPSSSPAKEMKPSPAPETKKTSDQPVVVILDVAEPETVKLTPAPSPEPKAALSPADPKPAPSSSPEAAAPKATTPTPESLSAPAPTPETPKPTTPEPIINGTPEPGPHSKPSPDHAGIGGSTQKAVHPKTPEMELKSSGAILEAVKDGTVAEDSTTTTWDLLLQKHTGSFQFPSL